MINKTYCFFIFLLFLSFQCKNEGVYFLVENKTNESFYVLSENELEDYKSNFLSKELLDKRRIVENDCTYIILEEYELNKFKDDKNIVSFYLSFDKNKVEKLEINKDKIESETINKIIHNSDKNEFHNTKIRN